MGFLTYSLSALKKSWAKINEEDLKEQHGLGYLQYFGIGECLGQFQQDPKTALKNANGSWKRVLLSNALHKVA